MNSHLDGALRCVANAVRRLEACTAQPHVAASLDDLELARSAMARMAELLQRAMVSGAPGVELLHSDAALREAVDRLIGLLGPMADEHGVTLMADVDAVVGTWSADLLEAVIENGLRNAIEAAATSPSESRHVEITLGRDTIGNLQICIADTGSGIAPGVDRAPNGNGIGLTVCRKIVNELGGTMRLLNRPYGAGAVLIVQIPVDYAEQRNSA